MLARYLILNGLGRLTGTITLVEALGFAIQPKRGWAWYQLPYNFFYFFGFESLNFFKKLKLQLSVYHYCHIRKKFSTNIDGATKMFSFTIYFTTSSNIFQLVKANFQLNTNQQHCCKTVRSNFYNFIKKDEPLDTQLFHLPGAQVAFLHICKHIHIDLLHMCASVCICMYASTL